MGRPLPLLPRRLIRVCARVLSLHRAQSGARGDGERTGRLPLVELRWQLRPGLEQAAYASRGVPGSRCRRRIAATRLLADARSTGRAGPAGGHPRRRQWRWGTGRHGAQGEAASGKRPAAGAQEARSGAAGQADPRYADARARLLNSGSVPELVRAPSPNYRPMVVLETPGKDASQISMNRPRMARASVSSP